MRYNTKEAFVGSRAKRALECCEFIRRFVLFLSRNLFSKTPIKAANKFAALQSSLRSRFYKCFILLLFLMQTTLSWSDTLQEKLTHAENSYQKALEAHTVAERQEALNDALSNYLDAYKEIPKETLAKGDVSYNMGNILYLLEEYPWAILYYLKALKNIPDNTYLEHNLALAREKLGIKVEKKNYTYWIEWPRYYPEQMFLKILFISSMAVLFFYGVKIWTKRSIWSYIAKFCLLGVLVGAYGLLYLRYIAPIEAVAMHPILLHRAPGERTPLVTSIPILAGSVLNVVEISRDEEWVKVSNQDGTVGYVPSDGLRFVVLLE